MNGISMLLANGFAPNVRSRGRIRQRATATFLAWLAIASLGFGQPPAPTKENAPWGAIRERIRQPRDFVARETGSGPETPLALTPDEVRDTSNGIVRVDRFENHLLDQIDKALAIMPQDIEQAESALSELIRAHHSWRLSRPTQDAWRSLRIPLEQRLTEVRAKRIETASQQQRAALLPSARAWLRIHGPTSKVGEAVKQWWLDEAKKDFDGNDAPSARRWHDRLIAAFGPSESLRTIENQLRAKADDLVKQSSNANTASATRLRQEARAIWPESLARLKSLESEKTLTIVSRTLPQRMSPGAAKTDDDRRAVDLLFRSLDALAYAKQWGPAHLTWHDRIASKRTWSDGSPISADDVRHTFRLLESSRSWRLPLRETLETTSASERGNVAIQLRHASFPWRDLHTAPIVPRLVGDRELATWDDAAFGRDPKTSGRYRLARSDKDPTPIPFHANPAEPPPFFERVEWTVAESFTKALTASKPDVVFDLNIEDARAAKKAGFAVQTAASDRGWFLMLNQRRPPFANAEIRRGVAFAIDRDSILKSLTLDNESSAKPLRGPFPPDSWQAASPPQIPATLDQLDAAATHLRKVKGIEPTKLTLLFAADMPDAEIASKAIVSQLNAACGKAELKFVFQEQGVASTEFHAALERRDFELAYLPLDHGNDLWSLWSLFDRDPTALEPNGSNLSGFTDAKLESLFRSALASRRVSSVREAAANIHAYFVETMPIIPLWRLPTRIALTPTIDAPEIDPLHPFASIDAWKRKK